MVNKILYWISISSALTEKLFLFWKSSWTKKTCSTIISASVQSLKHLPLWIFMQLENHRTNWMDQSIINTFFESASDAFYFYFSSMVGEKWFFLLRFHYLVESAQAFSTDTIIKHLWVHKACLGNKKKNVCIVFIFRTDLT